jgi:hypothetical protein
MSTRAPHTAQFKETALRGFRLWYQGILGIQKDEATSQIVG